MKILRWFVDLVVVGACTLGAFTLAILLVNLIITLKTLHGG